MAWVVYAARLAAWWVRRLWRRLRRPPEWIQLLVESVPPVLPPPRGPLWRRFLGRPEPSLRELGEQLRGIAGDGRVKGVLLHLRPMTVPAARAEALAELVAGLRRSGVRVVCWAPSYTAATYTVACACDEVLLQPGGGVAALGLARGYVHLAAALDRVGVRADLLQITPYKTAGDVLTKREMTREAREMADWLADGAFAELLARIGRGRGRGEAAARALVDGSPYTDEQALAAGAVDGIAGEDELPERLGAKLQAWSTARQRLRPAAPPRPGRAVGLLRIEGLIVDGRSRRPPMRLPLPLLGNAQAGDLTVVRQARRLAASRRVGAVLVWVESGGGSATASEAIAGALRAAAARKPMVAVMGDVAGSGGYYVTTPARRVFAQPGTLTGSIGVLGGKLVAGGLLDRLLFNRTLVARGEHAAMNSGEHPYTDAERAHVRAAIERSYALFLQRVADARHRPVEDVEAVAGGRLWTGRQALERGLVDELGGLEPALAEARRLGGLRADAPLVDARGEGEVPAAATAGAAAILEHAQAALGSFDHAAAWWLCPWWAGGEA